MIKIFIPINKGKEKSNIRGFWRNAEGKIFYDYLSIKEVSIFNDNLAYNLKKKYNQEALFYVIHNKGYIYNSVFDIIELNNHIIQEVKPEGLKQSIKQALKAFSGCTVYIKDNKYFIEIFY